MQGNTIANLNPVATWISNLSIAGMGIRDLHNIPEVIQPQDCPIMCPDMSPPAFMDSFTLKRLTMKDSVNGRRFEVHYNLHYMMFYANAQEDISWLQKFGDLADMFSQAVTVMAVNETPDGAWDIRPTGAPHFGFVSDSAGTAFYGVRFTLAVTEFD